VLGWWLGEAALDRVVRGSGGASLIKEGVVGSCDYWFGVAAAVCFFWEILDGWGGRLRFLLSGVWGLSVGVCNA
jgi:hypothetical protein